MAEGKDSAVCDLEEPATCEEVDVGAKCQMCFEGSTAAFCRQCSQFICAECVKSHRRMKRLFSGHKITTLEEMREEGVKQVVTHQEPALQTCKPHESQPHGEMFCFDCGCLICRDCSIKDHHGHNYESIKKVKKDQTVKKRLSQHLEPLREIKDGLVHAVKEVQTARSELEAKGPAVVGRIEKWCD